MNCHSRIGVRLRRSRLRRWRRSIADKAAARLPRTRYCSYTPWVAPSMEAVRCSSPLSIMCSIMSSLTSLRCEETLVPILASRAYLIMSKIFGCRSDSPQLWRITSMA